MGAYMICDHADSIICDCRVLSDTEQFHCLPLYKGKGDAWKRGKLMQCKADKAGHESPGED